MNNVKVDLMRLLSHVPSKTKPIVTVSVFVSAILYFISLFNILL